MTPPIDPSTLHFDTADGWRIEASLFAAQDPQCAIILSVGTGFPRHFYEPAARYLAARGAVVLTYDYRGMGGSVGDPAAFAQIAYSDWGRFDTPAAITEMSNRYPDLPLYHLAHSVGGHFLGLIDNHARISKHAFISVGTGYFGGHHKSYLLREFYFWWGLGSYSLWRHGAVERVGGWQGEPLPPKLFRTWRRWSHRKAYFQPDLKTELAPEHYQNVTSPIASWIFTDDPIATETAAGDILACYPNAPKQLILKAPQDYGVKRIGHEGAFRKGREALWGEIWDWFVTP
ncbi:MAG: alpha/beta fold hydrolase [Hyphomicrobiales bacterium]|nr:alpha/beta fold hydrolase [Hyphomicrobiales bacterium]